MRTTEKRLINDDNVMFFMVFILFLFLLINLVFYRLFVPYHSMRILSNKKPRLRTVGVWRKREAYSGGPLKTDNWGIGAGEAAMDRAFAVTEGVALQTSSDA